MRSKYARCGCVYIGALILTGCASSANRSVAIGREEPEIRAARARFNTAIAERDTATIAGIFLPAYHIVTGKNDQGQGIASEVQHWRDLFADKSLLYVRRTREVRVNDDWGLAEELGDWTGKFTAVDGPVNTSGSYAAKWQRDTSGHWRLLAEVFTTLACSGGPKGCSLPQPASP